MAAITEAYPEPKQKQTRCSVQTLNQHKTTTRRPSRGGHDSRAVTRANEIMPSSGLGFQVCPLLVVGD
eukprot:6715725-Lingulodinium_polyedra.AAC.1